MLATFYVCLVSFLAFTQLPIIYSNTLLYCKWEKGREVGRVGGGGVEGGGGGGGGGGVEGGEWGEGYEWASFSNFQQLFDPSLTAAMSDVQNFFHKGLAVVFVKSPIFVYSLEESFRQVLLSVTTFQLHTQCVGKLAPF